jgi:hypothetical protein
MFQRRGSSRTPWKNPGVLDARGLRRVPRAERDRVLEHAVQIETERRPVERRRGVIPRVVQQGRRTREGMVQSRRDLPGPFLEVDGETARRAVDAEEEVHVQVASFRLSASLANERNGLRDAPRPGGRHDSRAGALEPNLDRERGDAQARRRAERHGLVRSIELQRGLTLREDRGGQKEEKERQGDPREDGSAGHRHGLRSVGRRCGG